MSMRKILIGLDYELFFGQTTGTVEKCLIEPTEYLLNTVEKYGAKLTLFVDAGYLLKLSKAKTQKLSKKLTNDFDLIATQLASLITRGHDIQLHIHPHWEDCHWQQDHWQINTDRYRLHDFNDQDKHDIVKRYRGILQQFNDEPVFAYRAGGWCLQPFDQIADALRENGIWLDSTVYKNGFSDDPTRWYDFRQCSPSTLLSGKQATWRFSKDPLVEDEQGDFVELPISSMRLGPSFYWRMAVENKLLKRNPCFGDGQSMTANSGYYLTRLLQTAYSPVSIDGLKANRLAVAFKQNSSDFFNIMGHPKSISSDSLVKLEQFLADLVDVAYLSFRDLKSLHKNGSNSQKANNGQRKMG